MTGLTARGFVAELDDGLGDGVASDRVPARLVCPLTKRSLDMDLSQICDLLDHPHPQVRLGAVSIMDFQARRTTTTRERRRDLYELYLRRHDRIDDWPLVDRAAPWVVGGYLVDEPRTPL